MSLSYAVMADEQAVLSDRTPVLFALGLFVTAVVIVYLSVAFGMPAPDVTTMVGP